jgi:hypothetical protein
VLVSVCYSFAWCFVLSWRWWIWLIQRYIQNTKIRYCCLILWVWFGVRVLLWLVGCVQIGTAFPFARNHLNADNVTSWCKWIGYKVDINRAHLLWFHLCCLSYDKWANTELPIVNMISPFHILCLPCVLLYYLYASFEFVSDVLPWISPFVCSKL